MKMIVALNNTLIEKRIVQTYKNLYDVFIVKNKEEILEITAIKEENLIITREDILGKTEFFTFIERIKEDNIKNRLVLIVKNLTKELKEKLFAKEVFNIIEGSSFLYEELIDNIDSPKLVIYKAKESNIKKSKIIIISGTRGSGKTLFTKMFSQYLAKNKNRKILAIDLDFIYPALDTYLQLSKNNSLIDLLKDLIDKRIRKLETYECVDSRYKNLKYILNNKSIGIPNDEILVNMLNLLKNYYDYIVVDTSTLMINKIYNLTSKVECQIIYLLEENIKSLREFLLDSYQIDKNILANTKFVLNKSKNNKEIINQISNKLPNKIILKIPQYAFLSFIIKNNIQVLKPNKLLKAIGIIKFEKLKLRIVQKILNLEEE